MICDEPRKYKFGFVEVPPLKYHSHLLTDQSLKDNSPSMNDQINDSFLNLLIFMAISESIETVHSMKYFLEFLEGNHRVPF